MPAKPLRALILEGGLNAKPGSSIEDLVAMTVRGLKKEGARVETVRLITQKLPPGLQMRMGKSDDWPNIARKIVAADILIIASPVWWGPGPSSLVQRVLERMDAFDEEVRSGKPNRLANKTAGVLTTGSEDGVQQVGQHVMNPLQFMGFALPPECVSYWVGEVGVSKPSTRERLAKNREVADINRRFTRNLAILARLLRTRPFPAR